MERLQELREYFERPLDKELEDYGEVIKMRTGTQAKAMQAVRENWVATKQAKYRQIFGDKTRILEVVEGGIDQDVNRYHLDDALRERLYELEPRHRGNWDKLYEAYKFSSTKLTTLQASVEDILRNKWPDREEKILRSILSEVTDQDIRHYVEMLWSSMLAKFKLGKCFLVWSINPLDLLLISEAGIHSCHSLDGDHCGGTLAYTQDRATSVLYVTTQMRHFTDLPVPAPRKKWRSLVYFDPECGIRLQRQYPDGNDHLADFAKNLVMRNLEEAGFPLQMGVLRTYASETGEEYQDGAFAGWYWREGQIAGIADRPRCPSCGRYYSYADIVCESCSHTVRCVECGDTIDVDNAIEYAGEYYCEYCADQYLHTCCRCGAVERCSEGTFVYAFDDLYCPECFDYLFEYCPNCGTIVLHEEIVEHDGEHYCENCYPPEWRIREELRRRLGEQTHADAIG